MKRLPSFAFLIGCFLNLASFAAAEKLPYAKSKIAPPTPEYCAAVENAAPAKATIAAPKRKLLVFSLHTGYNHEVIPHVDRVFEILGKKSGAFDVAITYDIEQLAADKLAGLADWAPASLLVLAGRLMSTPQAGAKLNVTNIPGPQVPLYSGGAELLEVWPFAPLYPSMGLGIAIVSYNGEVYFGLTADPGLVPDVEAFTGHLRVAAERCLALASSP